MQLKPLESSKLKGAGINIPSAPFQLDPDWEVDPESLNIEEKIGASPTMSFCIISFRVSHDERSPLLRTISDSSGCFGFVRLPVHVLWDCSAEGTKQQLSPHCCSVSECLVLHPVIR